MSGSGSASLARWSIVRCASVRCSPFRCPAVRIIRRSKSNLELSEGIPIAATAGMRAGRRCLGIVAALGLSLSAACAHGRQTSRGLSPTAPPRHLGAASSDGSRPAQESINSVRKQFGPGTSRPQSGDDPGQPVAQMGSGTARPSSTTGVVAQPVVSGAWSSVVSETPAATPRPSASTPGQSLGPPTIERRLDRTALRATIVACILVAAILWLPRRLHP